MRKKDAYLLNQCFVILAFVLSLNGYERTGMLVSCVAIVYSQYVLSSKVLQRDWLLVFSVSFLELCCMELSGINQAYPSLYFLSLSSLIVSFTWSHAGYKALHYGMQWMKYAGILFLVMCVFSSYYRFGIISTFLIVAEIFFPSNILYMIRQYRYMSVIKHRKARMSVVK